MSEKIIPREYRKRSIVIKAVRLTESNAEALAVWCGGKSLPGGIILIPTLEGIMAAGTGDWIVRGVQGEFYPIKESIFHETYEATYQRLSAFYGAALHDDCSYDQCCCDCHQEAQ